jgi:superfamily I DNA/RNA helicase
MPSAFPGGCPTVTPAATQSAELDALVAKVRSWTEDGVDPSEIAVATRFHQLGSRAKERLVAEGIPVVALKDGPDPSEKGVRIATMHAMKGLEFRCVAVIGVNDRAFPFDAAVTPIEVDRMQHEVDMLAGPVGHPPVR